MDKQLIDKEEVYYELEFVNLLKELPEEKKKEMLYILHGYILSEQQERQKIEARKTRMLD